MDVTRKERSFDDFRIVMVVLLEKFDERSLPLIEAGTGYLQEQYSDHRYLVDGCCWQDLASELRPKGVATREKPQKPEAKGTKQRSGDEARDARIAPSRSAISTP